jgi:hypothetical protein
MRNKHSILRSGALKYLEIRYPFEIRCVGRFEIDFRIDSLEPGENPVVWVRVRQKARAHGYCRADSRADRSLAVNSEYSASSLLRRRSKSEPRADKFESTSVWFAP